MNYPEDVMSLLRQCHNVSSAVVVDNAKSHPNSVTDLTQHMTSSSVPPPLRPYMKTIGSAKRKRNVSQKIMDRWTTGTTSTSAITDGLLSHPTPLHHTNVANNQRTSRNSICLSPMKLPNCSDNMGRNKCDPFSSTSLTSPTTTTTTTSHAMLLYSMLYNGGSDRSYRSHDGKAPRRNDNATPPTIKKHTATMVGMDSSPPSDSSPRLVRRLPSDDGGMDDLHRMMMVPDKQSHHTNDENENHNTSFETNSNSLLKRYAALPRRPHRPSSARRGNHTTTTSDLSDDDANENSDDDNLQNANGPTTSTMILPKKKVNGIDLSPRKPARRFVSRTSDTILAATPIISPLSTTTVRSEEHQPQLLLSSSMINVTRGSPHHHHHSRSSPRTTTTNRDTVRSSHEDHDHHQRQKSHNNHRTVKYLVEALTIVNLCDIENNISSIHQTDNGNNDKNHSATIADGQKESKSRRSYHHQYHERQPSTMSGNSSSDESTVESIPSRDSGHTNHQHENNNGGKQTPTKNSVPPTRTLSSSSTTRFPQAA